MITFRAAINKEGPLKLLFRSKSQLLIFYLFLQKKNDKRESLIISFRMNLAENILRPSSCKWSLEFKDNIFISNNELIKANVAYLSALNIQVRLYFILESSSLTSRPALSGKSMTFNSFSISFKFL